MIRVNMLHWSEEKNRQLYGGPMRTKRKGVWVKLIPFRNGTKVLFSPARSRAQGLRMVRDSRQHMNQP